MLKIEITTNSYHFEGGTGNHLHGIRVGTGTGKIPDCLSTRPGCGTAVHDTHPHLHKAQNTTLTLERNKQRIDRVCQDVGLSHSSCCLKAPNSHNPIRAHCTGRRRVNCPLTPLCSSAARFLRTFPERGHWVIVSKYPPFPTVSGYPCLSLHCLSLCFTNI